MARSYLRNSVSIMAVLWWSAVFAGESGDMVAANAPASNPDMGAFNLGQIEQVTISADAPQSQAISQSTISAADIYKFNDNTVDRALDLTTGVESGSTGGPRNEKLFFVRGFDRFESPLYIDGIRVYLPADNRVDLGFFLTPNLAQIQIDKGYVSVLSGPGALGGAVNLVTRKPTEPFEYEARAGASFDNTGGYNGFITSALVGGNDGKIYWQASVDDTKTDYFRLSKNFTPTATENGGIRDHSGTDNYGTNLKVGYTPNATNEYSLSYSGTWADKEATLSVSDPVASQKDWTWPYWDVQSLYFLSNTRIGQTAYIKTKAYYNSFRNLLSSYDNANYNTQTTAKAFQSYYSDWSTGASVEAGNTFFGRDELKGAFFFRQDDHTEWQQIFSPPATEPRQTSIENTYSIAGENRFHVTDQVDFVMGGSYDWRDLLQAQDYVDPTINAKKQVVPGTFVNYPVAGGSAGNVQGALIYNFDATGHVYADISDRSRFPTLMERFSTKFGSTLSNPDLKAERAVNYEIGGGETFFGNTHVDGALFYSDVTDAIESVPILFCDTTATGNPKNCMGSGSSINNGVSTSTMQSQNVGSGRYAGFEISADSRPIDVLQLGLRFTYIDRELDAQNKNNPPLPAGYHLTGLAPSQFMAYATWTPIPNLDLTPNVQLDSNRWSNLSGNMNVFLQTGAFFLVNFQANYAITDHIHIQAGARNLLDQDYQIVAGFPSEGRNFFINVRVRS